MSEPRGGELDGEINPPRTGEREAWKKGD